MRTFCLAIAAAILSTGAAGAATLNEGSFGDFSGDWKNPTIVDAGFDSVSGSWSGQNDHDLLGFTSLRKGAQTVTLSFTPKSPISPSDNGFATGGAVRYKFSALDYSAWEGDLLGEVKIKHESRDNDFTYTLELDGDFDGILYLMLFNTYDNTRAGLNYNISVPGNALAEPQPAPVPLPAGAALLPAGLAALAFLRRRKTR